jgi:flagellar biosynthesis/type III secretory pathway M-ring protein FliF/YscJ
VRDNYDFSDAIKNPFAGRINGKYTVTVHYDFTDKEKREEEIDHENHTDKDAEKRQA